MHRTTHYYYYYFEKNPLGTREKTKYHPFDHGLLLPQYEASVGSARLGSARLIISSHSTPPPPQLGCNKEIRQALQTRPRSNIQQNGHHFISGLE